LWIFRYLLIFFFYLLIVVMENQGSGNIDYSFDKTKYYKIIDDNISTFSGYYIIIIFISFFFITGSFIFDGQSLSRYISKEKNNNGKLIEHIENKVYKLFKQFCFESPYNIIEMDEKGIEIENNSEDNNNNNNNDNKQKWIFIGFTQKTYLFLIITNLIGVFILIEALVKNLMSSIIVNFVQENKQNNPYDNSNCIIKIDESPDSYIKGNYRKLMGLSYLFLIPCLIPFVLKFLNLDLYDIKKTKWVKYYIFISLIIPTILLIIYRLTGHKSITIFDTINKFIQNKDLPYINFMKQMFNLKFFIILIFLFILIIFVCLFWIYSSVNKDINGYLKYFYYLIIIFTIYFFIPSILSSNAVSSLYSVYKDNNIENNEIDTINSIEKGGVQSLYDLIVKYNYPCFKK
jgi:hypothetical protein